MQRNDVLAPIGTAELHARLSGALDCGELTLPHAPMPTVNVETAAM